MRTILIEGTELSGKTALVCSLEKELSAKGYRVHLNTGPLRKNNPLVNIPLTLGERLRSSWLREVMYTVSLMTDNFPTEANTDFFLQERHFPSVMAYSRVFNPFGINRHLGGILRLTYPFFDTNILITVNPLLRLTRVKERKNKTWLDRMIEENPRLATNLERELKDILSKERNYFEVDTSETSVESSTDYILRRII